ncbi:MAG TPA: hypothetical protein DCR44_06470 [Acholeplasmatales bacterium]|nr:hypothetical protein [Acholeplasmatales bacterium]
MEENTMNDKEIYDAILNDDNLENITMTDDDGHQFEMAQIGTMPMHDVVYGILELLKIDGRDVTEEEAGLVMLELDCDDETGEIYVTTVDEDDIFDEVIEAFNALPED